MSTDRVRAHLSERGWTGEILEFDGSSATVQLAAERLGTDPERIAKTLGFADPARPGSALLVVVAGDARVNGGKFKRSFGGKPRMLRGDEVEALTGHPIGGVCPFANPPGTRVLLDESLRRFDVVYPAAGTPSSAVRLRVDELERLTGAEGWVDVTAGPAGEPA
ncbi:YbaK/EbsC family protein [Leucobacter massiliensis]|uniref:EBSC protein n=1 Tax=Leucobacter massiliensis TaxID=1686285 RepID=A0A2S9QQH4_9MICO|nr:YbaK/EbsC family protein [Leucobacter massiliensis]PRI11843.1 EBSC protein [Leucobacter massiliensis]